MASEMSKFPKHVDGLCVPSTILQRLRQIVAIQSIMRCRQLYGLMEMYFSKQAPQSNSWVRRYNAVSLSETAERERGPGIWVCLEHY